MTTVDQQKIRRARTGLIAHDPARAQPGYTLFTPMFGGGTVDLVDMAGGVGRRWGRPFRPGLYAHLPRDLYPVFFGMALQDAERFVGVDLCKGEALQSV